MGASWVLSKLACLTLWRSIQLLAMLTRGDAAKDLELLLRRQIPRVTPQARNLPLVVGDQGRRVCFLLRDHDATFTRSFDDLFRSQDADILV